MKAYKRILLKISGESLMGNKQFGLDNKTNLRSFKHAEKDFSKHNDAYKFILNYFDKYSEFPDPDVLCENFPTLDKTVPKTISIPVGWWVTEENREYIVDCIRKGW